ncbi:aromatic amino acid transport family protein [Halomonas sp. GXIMD04776]|uniref:aromatic amino acid transport family protein n=1 Tax=Halomonas sp. GXIMD04776 TaxID=3415605 RepID=UPI003C8E0A7E
MELETALLLLVLIAATLIGPGVEWKYLANVSIIQGIPIFSLVLFSFISQYTVPAIARGFAESGNVRRLPSCIVTSQIILGLLFIAVVAVTLGLSGPDEVTEVATVAWGQALGPWAFIAGNVFTLLAFVTSFWAIGETALTNLVDQFKFPSEWDVKYRLIAITTVAVPPFIVAYSDFIGFVDAISFAGAFAGVLMAVLPILMVNRARKHGDRKPEWTCGNLAHPMIQGVIVIIFTLAALYTVYTRI